MSYPAAPSPIDQFMHPRRLALLAVFGILAAACSDTSESGGVDTASVRLPAGMSQPAALTNADRPPPAIPFDTATPRATARAVSSWPHDTAAYTQGLVVDGARLFESTGGYGGSSIRLVERTTGRTLDRTDLPATDFGEGITLLGDRVHSLTWQKGHGRVFRSDSLVAVDSFTYGGEGWGLATDGQRLYLSDGTSRIRVLNPETHAVERTVVITEAGREIPMLNELEWVRGELWANIYQTDWIARIDPATGHVVGWVNVGALLTADAKRDVQRRGGTANGIAFDSARNRVLVTGKLWPALFELEVSALMSRSRR